MEKFKRAEVIRLAEIDFNFFAALCLPHVMEFDFPPEYLAMSDMVEESARSTTKEDHNFALGLPRGFAKTTWAKLMAAWLFCFTDKQYILTACSNESKAQSFNADVAKILSSPNLTRLFGSYTEGAEKDSATLKIFTYRGLTRVLHAVGANGDPRGYNISFLRPDVHVCDDIQSRDNARSEAESKTLYEWYLSTFYLTKTPKGLLHIFIGNTFPYQGCILSKIRKDRNYTSFIVGAILSNGESLWPQLNSVEKLKADFRRLIDAKQPEIFLSELMNDDRSVAAIGFDYASLREWDKEDYISPMSGFVMIDVAGDKKDADDTAIGVSLFYDSLNLPYFRDLAVGKFSPLDTIKHALRLATKYNIQTIFIEAVAYQSSLLFWAKYVCNQFGLEGFNFLPISPRRIPKNVRIMDALRALQAGQIILHDDISAQVLNQISEFDPTITNNRDDIIDLLDYMREIPQKHPTEISLLLGDSYMVAPTSLDVAPWANSPI